MAEFCKQCADELGFPESDFIGMTSEADWEQNRAAMVLCEGCGMIQVDPQGNCMSTDCDGLHRRREHATPD